MYCRNGIEMSHSRADNCEPGQGAGCELIGSRPACLLSADNRSSASQVTHSASSNHRRRQDFHLRTSQKKSIRR